ncbi:MAG: hypothetical protein GF401_12560 [Chitinivibrionales bacterium]|nr:hypothetical protein [Chitinivibrionales bacterium]
MRKRKSADSTLSPFFKVENHETGILFAGVRNADFRKEGTMQQRQPGHLSFPQIVKSPAAEERFIAPERYPKTFSLKGFVNLVTASPRTQRKLLSSYKHPRPGEPGVRIIYYEECRYTIKAFHRLGEEPGWLHMQGEHLQRLASGNIGNTQSRLLHNADVLRSYAQNFGNRNYELLDSMNFHLMLDDIIVAFYPDMHVREGNREKIIKFEFGKSRASEDYIRILCTCMYESVMRNGKVLPESSVLYQDIPHGIEHRASKHRARLWADIEATSRTITDIWDNV